MGTGKIIFIVDDNLDNLTFCSKVLEDEYDVITMNSGMRLINILEKRIPDLILLDVNMPDMDGFSVIKKLKANERFSHIPVIFLTAKTDNTSELEGLSLGAVDYITKPFSPPLLCKRIELHLLLESREKELIAKQDELLMFNENLQTLVDEKTKTVVELQNVILGTLADLVENRDDITGGHIDRTQDYLRILIEAMMEDDKYSNQISSWNIDLLLQSAQLHDIGKISIEDSILRKPDALSPEEFIKIQEHAEIGRLIIEKIEKRTSQQDFLEQAMILASTHHEKWDGSGYPNALKGEEIPLQGRLMAIADVYDALISDRPYKKALSHEEAVNIIVHDSGSHFDPSLVKLFISVADEFNRISGQNH